MCMRVTEGFNIRIILLQHFHIAGFAVYITSGI